MKILNRTKIEYCDFTWNPVIGCKNNCPYCYAKIMNDRFHFIDNWNNPEWIQSNFDRKRPKKSSNIFVNSMSDLYYWKFTWMYSVINKIKQYPQHNFLFLTKFPEIYSVYNFPENCFLGATFTKQSDFELLNQLDFISIEPIQEMIDLSNWKKELSRRVKWIILGMESGNRKNKIIPHRGWLNNIAKFCLDKKVSLFMKNNLKFIWGLQWELTQEFPKELKHE